MLKSTEVWDLKIDLNKLRESFFDNAGETPRALNSSYITEEVARLPLPSRHKQKFRRRLYEGVVHFIFLRVSGIDLHRRLQFNAHFR